MAAPSAVLFALHNSLEPRGFENLCVDLLVREGYSRIIPGGKSRDRGRDAEVRSWIGPQQGIPQTAFQFSMEARWESKLRKDIPKITQACDTVDRIVFISSRSISVEKQDKLRSEFRTSENVVLEILDEGWFRVRLEEDSVDLALKHLGILVKPTPGFHATQIKLHGLTDENQEEMLRHTTPETLRATLIAQTRADPKNASAWKGLAHVFYYVRDYENALVAISKALKYSYDEVERWNLVALKASVIAEQGIKTGSRLLLKKARELFTPFVDRLGRAIDHYNLGNILGALEQPEKAERHYRSCLELDPNYAQAWKNLGSLLIRLNRQEEGMECLDRALELKPDLLEALCTKANVLVMSSDDCAEALLLMDRAFALDPDLELRWPHAHYWYAMALCRQGRLNEAFAIVEDRLERKFDCIYLGGLTNDILGKLWRSDPSYLSKAEAFFALRIDSKERDYRALIEMMDILQFSDRESEAWSLFDDFLGLRELSVRTIAARIPLSISDFTDSFASIGFYRRFREVSPLFDYACILDNYGLHPHEEVPEVLFHLLLPAYFKLGPALQDSCSQSESESEIEILLDTYRLISRTFAAFGGLLLSLERPVSVGEQSELLAAGVVVGIDFPLMEISRLFGHLFGVAGRDIPENYENAIVESAPAIHEAWLVNFLGIVGSDWGIGSF